MASRASGFCIYNDVAVAIAWLVDQGQRVAYVDIDAHHGDGVQAAFYDTDQVLTISLHQDGRTLFPGTGSVDETGIGAGVGYSANVPLRPWTDDQTYLWAFREVVPPLVDRFVPDVLVTQLGADTHFRDPLTALALTTAGHKRLFKELSELATCPWLACGGGGYNLDVVPRSWTLAFGTMSGQRFEDVLPESYLSQFGDRHSSPWLHDHNGPGLDPKTLERARHHAEAAVDELRQRLAF
jgi:acetoin utilization protein AcuC